MEKVLLCIVVATALHAVVPLPARSYHFIDELKTWTEAQSYCRQKYTGLATIENEEDLKILKDTAALLDKTYTAWIGLYDDLNSWRWSMSDPDFYQNDQNKFRKWRTEEPNNEFGKQTCGEITSDGFWNDEACSRTQASVCIDKNGPTVTFVIISTLMNWTEAQRYCREHHTDLASVRNEAENLNLKELMLAERKVWIGLYRDSWKWANRSSSSFRYWGSVEPSDPLGNCAAANFGKSGEWEDWICDGQKAFICYSAPCAASLPAHKYHFVDELKTWTEAQSYCRQKYSDLATIESMEDVETLNNMAASMGKNYLAWIGLYEDVSSWRWSILDSNFYQYDENNFRNWKAGSPDNWHGIETCAEMNYSGSWNDASCSLEKKPICFDMRGPNVTFVIISTLMNWTEAQRYCREHHTDLASVRNEAENLKVKELMLANELVWIGLYRDSWKWADGSSSSFSNWNDPEPNNYGGQEENCATASLGNSGKWEDWNCNSMKASICYSALCSNSAPPARSYHFVDELKNWTKARRYCRETYTDLATIGSLEDMTTINNMAQSQGKTYEAWIGFYNDVNSWRWSFSDPDFSQRQKDKFNKWSDGEPNNDESKESCAAISTDGSWSDVPCSQSLKVVCIDMKGVDFNHYTTIKGNISVFLCVF
ncbi:macrophage mannose receptor 1-like [Kryptolebias marmoratus]|uniref:macrophage mannose receptor 1-like n=1 Tax=Kryptolebias marmoratus TaxID=37003 RepID=UPI0018ACCED3|nr:macrophage mannose receptor 1-like [Kryptolebias marmoratus]